MLTATCEASREPVDQIQASVTFPKTEAILTHLGNVVEILGPVAQLGEGIEIELFGGSPSDELVQPLAMFRPTHYPHFQGK